MATGLRILEIEVKDNQIEHTFSEKDGWLTRNVSRVFFTIEINGFRISSFANCSDAFIVRLHREVPQILSTAEFYRGFREAIDNCNACAVNVNKVRLRINWLLEGNKEEDPVDDPAGPTW